MNPDKNILELKEIKKLDDHEIKKDDDIIINVENTEINNNWTKSNINTLRNWKLSIKNYL